MKKNSTANVISFYKIKSMREVNKNTVGVRCVLSRGVCVVAEVVVVVVA